jgi:hypothetical protein
VARQTVWVLQEPRWRPGTTSFETTYVQSGNQLAVTLAQDRHSVDDALKQGGCGDLVLALQDGGRRIAARYNCRSARDLEAELEFVPHGW